MVSFLDCLFVGTILTVNSCMTKLSLLHERILCGVDFLWLFKQLKQGIGFLSIGTEKLGSLEAKLGD